AGTSRTVSLGAAVPSVVYTGFDEDGRLMLAGARRGGVVDAVSFAAEQADGTFERWDYTLPAGRTPRFLTATQYWEHPAVLLDLANPRRLLYLHRERDGWRSASIALPITPGDFAGAFMGDNAAGELHVSFVATSLT